MFSTEFQEKSWISVHFKIIQDFSRVVPSSPVPSRIFPEFFPNFPEQQDQTFLVLSRSRQFGNGLQSHLVWYRAWECRPLTPTPSCVTSLTNAPSLKSFRLFFQDYGTGYSSCPTLPCSSACPSPTSSASRRDFHF